MNDDAENPWADSAETARTFDAASGDFDELTPTVWGPAGQALVFQLGVAPGEAVLDACCGTGSSALPAAAAVGPEGLVHGVDVADEMLEHGRLSAERRGLKNIEFVCADASQWEAPSDVPDAGYDVLSISYGVFFLPDMDRTFWRLVSLVRQGGRAGVTVWRRGAMEEFSSIVFDVASRYSPELRERGALRDRTPLHRIDTPDTLEAWLADAGTDSVEVRTLSNLLPATDELCWSLVTGTGLHAVLTGLGSGQVASVRQRIAEEVTARGLHTIDATTLVATGTVRRPPVSG
jgi:ubiquinone/menaquinone biosynthesis C-methylase UbiE